MRSIAASMRAFTARMSTFTSPVETPYFSAVRAAWARRAEASNVFDGTQPVHVQSPPKRAFSMRATRFPNLPAYLAAPMPALPLPMTRRS